MQNQPPKPPSKISAQITLVLLLVVIVLAYRMWLHHLPFLERHYLLDYVRLQVPEKSDPTTLFDFGKKFTVYKNGNRMALPSDMQVEETHVKVDRERFALWLQTNIYNGQECWRVFLTPLVVCTFLSATLWYFVLLLRNRRYRESYEGMTLRGPKVLPQWRFNLRFWRKRKGLYILTK